MITFHCPSCSMKLQVPAQMAGVTGPCPECSASITAPQPGATGAIPPSTLATAPIPQPAQQQPVQQAPQQQAPQQAQAQPQAQPAVAVAPNPLAQNTTPQPRDTPSPQGNPQQRDDNSPVARERLRQQEQRTKPRARWMRVVFPVAFLIVAATLVLAVLQAVGIFNVWDLQSKDGELISNTGPSNANTDATTPDSTGNTTPDPKTPADGNVKPAVTPPEDKTPTEGPPSMPVIKDNTHTEGEFPDFQLPPPPKDGNGSASSGNSSASSGTAPPTTPSPPAANPAPPSEAPTTPATTSQDESPPKAGFLANQTLNKFLAAKTLDERLVLMSKSTRTREELMASCLAGPLKPVKSVQMVEMVPRLEDNMTQYLYFVSFEDKEEDRQRQRILVQVVERPGTHAPLVHADAFIEHYDKKFIKYAKHPNNEVTTFHCIAEARTADLAKDLPKELKETMVRLVIKTHPHGGSAFDAYLNKNSPLMEQIGPRKDFPYTENRFCVLSFRWNTKDANRPYIELNDIVSQGWER